MDTEGLNDLNGFHLKLLGEHFTLVYVFDGQTLSARASPTKKRRYIKVCRV